MSRATHSRLSIYPTFSGFRVCRTRSSVPGSLAATKFQNSLAADRLLAMIGGTTFAGHSMAAKPPHIGFVSGGGSKVLKDLSPRSAMGLPTKVTANQKP